MHDGGNEAEEVDEVRISIVQKGVGSVHFLLLLA